MTGTPGEAATDLVALASKLSGLALKAATLLAQVHPDDRQAAGVSMGCIIRARTPLGIKYMVEGLLEELVDGRQRRQSATVLRLVRPTT